MQTTDLAADLKRLRLPGMADNLDRRTREAEESKLGYLEFAALLIQDEVASRDSNSFQKRLKTAGFATRMTFESFDFEFNGAVMPAPLLATPHKTLHRCRPAHPRRLLLPRL